MGEEPEKKEEAKPEETKPEGEAKPAEGEAPKEEPKPEHVEHKVKLDIIKKILDDGPQENKEGAVITPVEEPSGEGSSAGGAPENKGLKGFKEFFKNPKKLLILAGVIIGIFIIVFTGVKLLQGPGAEIEEKVTQEEIEAEPVSEEEVEEEKESESDKESFLNKITGFFSRILMPDFDKDKSDEPEVEEEQEEVVEEEIVDEEEIEEEPAGENETTEKADEELLDELKDRLLKGLKDAIKENLD